MSTSTVTTTIPRRTHTTCCKGGCSCCSYSYYTLGLLFIFLVALIWSAASILVQYLYTEQSFDSPFLLTYIGTSLFTLLLPTKCIIDLVKNSWFYFLKRRIRSSTDGHDHDSHHDQHVTELHVLESSSTAIVGRHSHGGGDNLGQYENVPSVESSNCENDAANVDDEKEDIDDVPYRDEPDDADEHDNADNNTNHHPERIIPILLQPQKWTNRQHIKVAFKIAPIWFLANWTYNASLAYTSITSSTVLASTGSLFTFLFATICRDEQFTWLKLLGVLLGFIGSLCTALHDANNHDDSTNSDAMLHHYDNVNYTIASHDKQVAEDEEARIPLSIRMRMIRHLLIGPAYRDGSFWTSEERALFGDALGLISAIGYGGYAVMVRVQCPRDESLMSMELLLGYIGLFNMVVLSPILFYQLFQGNHSQLTLVVFGFLVIKGLLDNVLSDYLWARAVVLTSATVATVGLGLTIPLAFLSDVFWMGQEGDQVVSLSSVAGAFSVLAGFVLVNIATDRKEEVMITVEQGEDDDDNDDLLVVTEENSISQQPVQLTEI